MINSSEECFKTLRLPKIVHKPKSLSTPASNSRSISSLQQRISAKAWLCITPTQEFGFRTGKKKEIASITKTMTALCTLELCSNFGIKINNTYFKVTSWAAKINGTSAKLEAHSWVSVEDLLYGLMLPSGNDAALVLAQNLGAVLFFDKSGNKQMVKEVRSIDLTEDQQNIKYYTQEFVSYMNFKAKSLQMTNTSFGNPHGLDQINNYSCCEDVIRMCREAMKSETVRRIVSCVKHKAIFKTFKGKQLLNKQIVWKNTNKLLERNRQAVFGIKTGITPKAGGCLATYFRIDAQNEGYIVVLGCSSAEMRFKDTQILLNHIGQSFH